MENPKVSNPLDFKVVEFFNNTNFDFTPELGAMYDGRPLFVGSGERKQFPYHIGHRLAENLAKAVLIKGAPLHDPTAVNPVGTPLWGEEGVKRIKASFLTELYSDEKPIAVSETDRLMNRVAELEELFQKQLKKDNAEGVEKVQGQTVQEIVAPETIKTEAKVYQDKAEVIAELVSKGIAHDKRKSKAELEKLLA